MKQERTISSLHIGHTSLLAAAAAAALSAVPKLTFAARSCVGVNAGLDPFTLLDAACEGSEVVDSEGESKTLPVAGASGEGAGRAEPSTRPRPRVLPFEAMV